MCQDSNAYKALMEITPRRNFEEIKDELKCIKEQYFEMCGDYSDKSIDDKVIDDMIEKYIDKYEYNYDYALIGKNDRIIPPENQEINHEEAANLIITDCAHYDEPMFRFLLQDAWEMPIDDFLWHLKRMCIQ